MKECNKWAEAEACFEAMLLSNTLMEFRFAQDIALTSTRFELSNNSVIMLNRKFGGDSDGQ